MKRWIALSLIVSACSPSPQAETDETRLRERATVISNAADANVEKAISEIIVEIPDNQPQ